MITFFAGSEPTFRLLKGMRTTLHDPEIAVVANTSDALWMSGHHLAPTLDASILLFAGLLNTSSWRGIRGDSYTTSRFVEKLGREEFLRVGDKERAMQIARAEMLHSGSPLTAVAEAFASVFHIDATILPMTDVPVAAYVETDLGPVHILAREQWEGEEIRGVTVHAEEEIIATEKVVGCIKKSDAVIIGPENPFTVVAPILGCRGVRESLQDSFVIVISPVTGPLRSQRLTKRFLEAEGIMPASAGVFGLYHDIADCFVIDTGDPDHVEGATRLPLSSGTRAAGESLAWDLLSLVRAR
ncbi:MAG: 2-phospho-L-lactate transferase CofD family protein [Methanomicrobiaceae archaeon]|nr:2-phospho-L-lactate transferase CofD family protein [Methanomicrobiaceae archaeon]